MTAPSVLEPQQKSLEAKQVLLVSATAQASAKMQEALQDPKAKWVIQHTSCPKEAMSRLANGLGLDALVVDLTSPDLKGPDLLKEAITRQPGALRIGLAAAWDESKGGQAPLAPAHQFLAKDSPPNALKAVLARAFAAQDFLAHDHFKKLLSGLQTLPVLPQIYTEVMDELESDDPSLERAGEIVSRDMGLSAKLLQMVNSAYFGLKRAANTPAEAVMFLGTEMTKALVLSLKVFSQFDHLKSPDLNLEQLWRQSWTTAIVARGIAQHQTSDQGIANNAFMSGLLHKSGILVFAANFPEYFRATLQYSRRKKVSFWEAEYQFYNASHAELGAYLFSLWGMPDEMIEAIAYHNRPIKARTRTFCALTALHVANGLFETGDDERALRTQPVDRDYLTSLGLLESLDKWKEVTKPLLSAK